MDSVFASFLRAKAMTEKQGLGILMEGFREIDGKVKEEGMNYEYNERLWVFLEE